MALIFDGREVDTETGANRSGKDLNDNPVVVSGTHEAIQDYGWQTIWAAGEAKYTRGSYEQIGNTRFISVMTADCAEEESDA